MAIDYYGMFYLIVRGGWANVKASLEAPGLLAPVVEHDACNVNGCALFPILTISYNVRGNLHRGHQESAHVRGVNEAG
jgi:hypothetical protein